MSILGLCIAKVVIEQLIGESVGLQGGLTQPASWHCSRIESTVCVTGTVVKRLWHCVAIKHRPTCKPDLAQSSAASTTRQGLPEIPKQSLERAIDQLGNLGWHLVLDSNASRTRWAAKTCANVTHVVLCTVQPAWILDAIDPADCANG